MMYHTLVTSMDNDTLWFDACKVRSCANVSIVGGMINGPYEIFHVSLELTSYLDCNIGLDHGGATISIINTNYGKANTTKPILCPPSQYQRLVWREQNTRSQRMWAWLKFVSW